MVVHSVQPVKDLPSVVEHSSVVKVPELGTGVVRYSRLRAGVVRYSRLHAGVV